MAMASVTCTCRICNKTFVRSEKFRSRSEANSWEAWAKKNFDLCNNCYRKQQAELIKKCVETIKVQYSLPELRGVSENQENYANILRDKHLAQNRITDQLNTVNKLLDHVKLDILQKEIDSSGKSKEDVLLGIFKGLRLDKEYAVLRISDAGKLIDVLKGEEVH